ncbi:MAG: M20/M25/M40 family metallo-hydrolase [Deltaproteobacteria bacterium]|nr:M20/M25/M40 family metallo-hydrolase [Deltaproteobacteria bacterium]
MLAGAIVLSGSGCASSVSSAAGRSTSASPSLDVSEPSLPSSGVDWGERTAEATSLLAELVRADTSAWDRSAMDAAAQAVVSFLRRNNVEAEVVPMGALGAGVFALLPAAVSDPEPPLLLASHLDTYSVDAPLWDPATPPFGAVISNDALFGRGVLSGKGAAAVWATTLAILGQRAARQDRDIILCLIPDGLAGERDGTKGLDLMIRRHPAVATASVAITGTGLGIDDWLEDGRTIHYVTHGELGFARLSVAALSDPEERNANARLARALKAIAENPPAPRLSQAAMQLFDAISDDSSFPKNLALRSELLARIFFLPDLADRPSTRDLAADHIRIAAIAGGELERSVPALRARALLWASLLPGTTPVAIAEYIRAVIEDPAVHLTILEGAEAYTDAPSATVERILRRHLKTLPNAPREVVCFGFGRGPSINRGLSRIGIRTYGIFPLIAQENDMRGIEGRNEHVSIANIRRALSTMTAIVDELTRAPFANSEDPTDIRP